LIVIHGIGISWAANLWLIFAVFSTCFLALLSGLRMELLKVVSFILITGYSGARKMAGIEI
jgi:hypothetical protein